MRFTAVLSCTLLLAYAARGQQAPPKNVTLTPIAPVKVEHRSDGVYFIDFGRDAFAQLKINLANAVVRKVTLRLGEKLADPDHLDPKPGGSIRFLQTTISGGMAKLTKNDARRMPSDIGSVMPFRYVELVGLPEGTTNASIEKAVLQLAANYPFDDNAAQFDCSNDELTAVWTLCRYSIKATSYAGIFVDGDRERKPYEADAYINGLGWYCCTDDLTLPPYTDQYLIEHPTWPTEWSMFSVLCAWNDYLYTGDLPVLHNIYPDLKNKCLRALEREDGLISAINVPPALRQSLHLGKETLRDVVDWPVTERDGYDLKPINTVVNAFHCQSLALMAKIAAALGNKADARDFQSAADKSLATFNSKLFDAGTGLYIDGEGSSHSSQHANMFPLAFGLVPAERRPKVVDFIKSRGIACSVYGAQFLMDGLFDNDAGNDALALMLAPVDRSWRHMVDNTGTTITLEAWDQKFKPNQDWNHAWGAAPANLIPRKVLGVEPAGPGFDKAIIAPRCASKSGSITWARGRVPTAKGPITIDWKTTANAFYLNVELPPDTTATVLAPPDWGPQAIIDGKAITGEMQGRRVALELDAGKHEISIGR
jgi:hypothetical protein